MNEITIIEMYLKVKEIANSCNLSFDIVYTENPSPIYMLSNKYGSGAYNSFVKRYEQAFFDIESALRFIEGYEVAYNRVNRII